MNSIKAASLQVQRGAYHDSYVANYGARPEFVPFDGSVIQLLSGDKYIVAAKSSKLRGPIEMELLRLTDGRSKTLTVWPSTQFPTV